MEIQASLAPFTLGFPSHFPSPFPSSAKRMDLHLPVIEGLESTLHIRIQLPYPGLSRDCKQNCCVDLLDGT